MSNVYEKPENIEEVYHIYKYTWKQFVEKTWKICSFIVFALRIIAPDLMFLVSNGKL